MLNKYFTDPSLADVQKVVGLYFKKLRANEECDKKMKSRINLLKEYEITLEISAKVLEGGGDQKKPKISLSRARMFAFQFTPNKSL